MKCINKHFTKVIPTIIIVGIFFSCNEINPKNENVNTSPPIEVSPYKLWKDYDDNEVAADLIYKNKYVIMSGKINEISRNFSDAICIAIDIGDEIHDISCTLSPECADEVSLLKKGQNITIRGTCDGKIVTLIGLNDCVIIK